MLVEDLHQLSHGLKLKHSGIPTAIAPDLPIIYKRKVNHRFHLAFKRAQRATRAGDSSPYALSRGKRSTYKFNLDNIPQCDILSLINRGGCLKLSASAFYVPRRCCSSKL